MCLCMGVGGGCHIGKRSKYPFALPLRQQSSRNSSVLTSLGQFLGNVGSPLISFGTDEEDLGIECLRCPCKGFFSLLTESGVDFIYFNCPLRNQIGGCLEDTLINVSGL